MSERFAGLIDLLSNRQMPDDATPKVTLGDLRALRAAGLAEGRSEREALMTLVNDCAYRFWPPQDGTPDYSDDPLYVRVEAALMPHRAARLAAHPTPPDPIDDTQRAGVLPPLTPIEGLDVENLLSPEQAADLNANLREMARARRVGSAAARTMPLGSSDTQRAEEAGQEVIGGKLGYKSARDCPDAAFVHSEPPADMDEDTGVSPTRVQRKCPTCEFWSVWAPREEAGR